MPLLDETCTTETITLPEIGCAIRSATEEVFSVMLGLDMTAGEAQIGKPGQDHSGVVAVLGLTGEWGGSGQVSCESGLAMHIASKLLLSNYDSVDEDVLDAVAEVANMIVGNVKTCLEHTLGAMRMSAPAVFFGGDFETRIIGKPTTVVVPFSCTEGSMTVPFSCRGGAMTVQIAVAPVARTRLRHRVKNPIS